MRRQNIITRTIRHASGRLIGARQTHLIRQRPAFGHQLPIGQRDPLDNPEQPPIGIQQWKARQGHFTMDEGISVKQLRNPPKHPHPFPVTLSQPVGPMPLDRATR